MASGNSGAGRVPAQTGKKAGTSASGDRPATSSSGRGGGQNARGSQGYKQPRAPDFGSYGRG